MQDKAPFGLSDCDYKLIFIVLYLGLNSLVTFFWFGCDFSAYEYAYCILMCLYYSCKYDVNLYPANFSVVAISKSYFICMLHLCHLFPADISGCLLSSRENCLLLLYISTAYLMLSTKHTSSHSSVTHRNKFISQDVPSLVFHWFVGGKGNRITGAFQLGLRQSCLVSKKMLITARFCCTSRVDTCFHTWVGLNNRNTAYTPPLRRKQLLK